MNEEEFDALRKSLFRDDAASDNSFGFTTSDEPAKALTEDDLREAMEALRNRPYRICTHVVAPSAEGWTLCGNCFQPVHQPKGAHAGCDGRGQDCMAEGLRRYERWYGGQL